jgi:hypothetical protein
MVLQLQVVCQPPQVLRLLVMLPLLVKPLLWCKVLLLLLREVLQTTVLQHVQTVTVLLELHLLGLFPAPSELQQRRGHHCHRRPGRALHPGGLRPVGTPSPSGGAGQQQVSPVGWSPAEGS